MKISPRQYADFIFQIKQEPQEKQADLVKKLADFIRKNRDVKKLDQIVRSFKELQDEKDSIKRIKITSKEELGGNLEMKIKNHFAGKFGITEDKIILEKEIDPKIMGGIIIKIGDEIWDGSVLSKFSRLKQAIIK